MINPARRVAAFLQARDQIPGLSRHDRLARVYAGERELVLSAADVQALVDRIDRIDALFAGGPDTVCRTTQRPTSPSINENITCVEVPIYDLVDAMNWPTPEGDTPP